MHIVDEIDIFLARSVIKAREPFPIACFQLKKKQNESRRSSFQDEEKARYGHLRVPDIKYKEVEQETTGGVKIRSKSIDLGRQQFSFSPKEPKLIKLMLERKLSNTMEKSIAKPSPRSTRRRTSVFF